MHFLFPILLGDGGTASQNPFLRACSILTHTLTHLNVQTNDLSERTPIVANEIRVPGLNAIPEMERGIAECIGMGNFKIAPGIKIEKNQRRTCFSAGQWF